MNREIKFAWLSYRTGYVNSSHKSSPTRAEVTFPAMFLLLSHTCSSVHTSCRKRRFTNIDLGGPYFFLPSINCLKLIDVCSYLFREKYYNIESQDSPSIANQVHTRHQATCFPSHTWKFSCLP